jgi:hypothetical protein
MVSPTIAPLNTPVTLQATVTVMTPGGGVPDGMVTFMDGTQALVTVPLVSGIATYQTTTLALGGHQFTAVEATTANFMGSTSSAVSGQVIPSRPAVQSIVINGGAAQRSRVTDVTITFNEQVTLAPGAIEIDKKGGSAEGLILNESVVNGETVVDVAFSGKDIIGGSLSDGNYTLNVNAADVQDAIGQTMAANASDTFWRLFGDARGTGFVDALDFQMCVTALRTQTMLDIFDYYGTGHIDIGDVSRVLINFGKHV